MNSILINDEEKAQSSSLVEEYGLDLTHDGPSWLPPVRPVSEASQNDSPKSLLRRLLSLIADVVNALAGGLYPRCQRCESEAFVLSGAYQEAGYGWWATSNQYRCLACDFTWDEPILPMGDPDYSV